MTTWMWVLLIVISVLTAGVGGFIIGMLWLIKPICEGLRR